VTELLLTIRMEIGGTEDGGETYLRRRKEALRHQWSLEPKTCCVFNYGR